MTAIISNTNPFEYLFELLFPGFLVNRFEHDKVKNLLTFYVEPKGAPICPHCGSHNVVVHQYRTRVVKDLSLIGINLSLVITYRLLKCHCCRQIVTENIPFVSDRYKVTKRLENEIINDLERAGSVTDTSIRYNTHWETCKNIHNRYLAENLPFTLGDTQFLAIDEISIKKGHKYATVFADLETRRVIWMVEGKKISEVDKFFKMCGTEGCKQIKAVATDQNAGFATCVNKYCPNAKVIYDFFHMVMNFGRLVISSIRIRLAGNAKEKSNNYQELKHSRFILLSRNANLTEEKRIKLNDILAKHKDLYFANELKELLPQVFRAVSKDEAEKLWSEWVKLAKESKVDEIVEFANNQDKRYRDGITNSGIYHIGTSVLEGINNKIKVIKRIAFGYTDFTYFRYRVMNAFRGNRKHCII